MAGLSVDEDECICTINCRAEHTLMVGTRSDIESTGVQLTSKDTDMRNVVSVTSPTPTLNTVSDMKNHVRPPQTPGLSTLFQHLSWNANSHPNRTAVVIPTCPHDNLVSHNRIIIQQEQHARKIINPPPCMTTSALVQVLFISSKQKWYIFGFKSNLLNIKTISNTNANVLNLRWSFV